MKKSTFMLGAAALLAAAGAAIAQPLTPLQLEYCVAPLGGGLYEYKFKLVVADNHANFAPGQGWRWLIFGDARRVSPLTGLIIPSSQFPIGDPSNFTEGPWTSLTSSGGGHNGPTMNPVLTYWTPTAVGDSLSWEGTATVFLAPGSLPETPEVLFSTIAGTLAGGVAATYNPAVRVNCDLTLGACCRPNGSCIIVSEAGCMNEGGVYRGNGSDCATANCDQPATGACCRTSGCAILTADQCSNTGGTYNGDNTTCVTAGCAVPPGNALTPPDFSAPSRQWVFSPSHTQVLSGGFNATGFRLEANGLQNFDAQHQDLLIELVAPNGRTLLIGGDTTPFVANSVRWDGAAFLSGTRPGFNGAPQNINSTYSWDFGPVDGEWTVNFWNNWGNTSAVNWGNITITMLDLPTGACCMADGTCVQTARGNCVAEGGLYNGDFTDCAGVTCNQFLATDLQARFWQQTPGGGQFLDLTAINEVSIIGFDYGATAGIGQSTTVEVWTINGSYVGNDTNAGAWVHHDTIFATSAGTGALTNAPLNIPIELAAGQTVGVYLIAQAGGLRNEIGQTTYGDSNLSLFSNLERSAPWSGNPQNRVFSGRVFYSTDVTPTCYANCDGSTTAPILNVDDFTCFINEFASAQGLPHEQQVTHYANCDNSTTAPALNVDDFTCFINAFATGCP